MLLPLQKGFPFSPSPPLLDLEKKKQPPVLLADDLSVVVHNKQEGILMSNKRKDIADGASRSSSASVVSADHQHHHHQQQLQQQQQLQLQQQQQATPLSRYESQKRRDWNTFGQYLRNQRPPLPLPQCNSNHVLDFLRYLDQFGKTKVHLQGCLFFGQPEPPGPCSCPLKQAWGSLDALIGRLRAAYEENGGLSETNPFASGSIRVHLREIRDSQAKARGIPYKKKRRRNSAKTIGDASNFSMK